jgi:PTH1 family peptidyl-tRNA hydrolase
MRLVAGLGNPGEKYAETPHNMGFLVVDALAARHSIRVTRPECHALVGPGTIAGEPVLLAKPQTFMNLSGVAVKALLGKYEILPRDLVVVYDELDLDWGALRIRPGGSAAGHNGVKDIIAKLGTNEFPRIRLGVHPGSPLGADAPTAAARRPGVDYLLSRMPRQLNETRDEFIGFAADAAESLIAQGVEKSMAKFNRRAPGSTEE